MSLLEAMIEIWKILLAFVVGLFKSKARLEAENACLSHQLNVLRRKVPHRLVIGNWDRPAFVWFCRLFPFLFKTTRIVTPATVRDHPGLIHHTILFHRYRDVLGANYNSGCFRQLIQTAAVISPATGA